MVSFTWALSPSELLKNGNFVSEVRSPQFSMACSPCALEEECHDWVMTYYPKGATDTDADKMHVRLELVPEKLMGITVVLQIKVKVASIDDSSSSSCTWSSKPRTDFGDSDLHHFARDSFLTVAIPVPKSFRPLSNLGYGYEFQPALTRSSVVIITCVVCLPYYFLTDFLHIQS